MVFQERLEGLKGNLEVVPREIYGYSKEVQRLFQGGSTIFKGCFKGASNKL